MTVELVLFFPVLVLFVMMLIALARVAYGRELVGAASAAASRSASLAPSSAQAETQARQSATTTLEQGGSSCTRVVTRADVTAFRPGGLVSVTVQCTARLSDLAIPGLPGSVTISSTSRTPLETYRQYEGAAQ
jgi:Flp pilus assembly protein TadG